MKLKITLYLSLGLLLIFSCSRDEKALTSNVNKVIKLEDQLVESTWKQSQKLDDKFTQQEEIQFFTNGSMVKRDSYNYLGIIEHFEEEGRWFLEPNGESITIQLKNDKEVQQFQIIHPNSTSLELMRNGDSEPFILTKS